MKSSLTEGKLSATFYYTSDTINWETWKAPVFDFHAEFEEVAEEDDPYFEFFDVPIDEMTEEL